MESTFLCLRSWGMITPLTSFVPRWQPMWKWGWEFHHLCSKTFQYKQNQGWHIFINNCQLKNSCVLGKYINLCTCWGCLRLQPLEIRSAEEGDQCHMAGGPCCLLQFYCSCNNKENTMTFGVHCDASNYCFNFCPVAPILQGACLTFWDEHLCCPQKLSDICQ